MNWIEEISREEYEQLLKKTNVNEEKFRIEKVVLNETRENLTLLAQFFLAPAALHDPFLVTYLPVHNLKIYNQAVNEIGIHYKQVKLSFFNEKPNTLILQDLYDESMNYLRDKLDNLHPIVHELFGSRELRSDPSIIGVTYMKINQDFFDNKETETESFNTVWEFIKESFSPFGSFCIVPINWHYSDQLKDSVTIRYFSKRSRDVVIITDTNSSAVLGIDLIL